MKKRKLVQIMPAVGYHAEFTDHDERYSEPVVAWGLYSDGTICALFSDSSGSLVDAASLKTFWAVEEGNS